MGKQTPKILFGYITEYLTWLWDCAVKLVGKFALACLVLAVGVPTVGLAAALVLVVGVPLVVYQAVRLIFQMFQSPKPVSESPDVRAILGMLTGWAKQEQESKAFVDRAMYGDFYQTIMPKDGEIHAESGT
tara:strand:+ start:639 stop:1031 length:393 start_codon:yes stop_codon:yes gene_type:complete